MHKIAYIQQEIVHIKYTDSLDSKKFEYPELLKFNGNCILYMYEFFEFTENLNSVDTLNVWNCVNLSGNYVDYIYGMSGFEEKLNIQNCVNSMRNCV